MGPPLSFTVDSGIPTSDTTQHIEAPTHVVLNKRATHDHTCPPNQLPAEAGSPELCRCSSPWGWTAGFWLAFIRLIDSHGLLRGHQDVPLASQRRGTPPSYRNSHGRRPSLSSWSRGADLEGMKIQLLPGHCRNVLRAVLYAAQSAAKRLHHCGSTHVSHDLQHLRTH